MVKKKYKSNKRGKIYPKQTNEKIKNTKNKIKENNKIKITEIKEKINLKNKISIKNSETNKPNKIQNEKEKNEDNLSIFDSNSDESSSIIYKDDFSVNSLIFNDSKAEFSFIKDNEKKWINYFVLSEKKDINKWELLIENAIEIFTKKEKEVDLLINLILKIDKIRKNSKYGNIKEKFLFYENPIYEIWNINYFENYFEECWKKYKFFSIYKRRYTKNYKTLLFKSWENILCFMGFNFIMKGEKLWNYIWYLWILPRKLIILWYARINVCEKNDFWWIVLLKEWFNYFMEILRVGNIKNWLINFIREKKSDYKMKKNFIKQLHMESGFANIDDCENNNDILKE